MFNQRLKKLRDTLVKNKRDALFVSNVHNSFYLTGYRTVAPEDRDLFVLVTENNTYAFTHALNYDLMRDLLSKSAIKPCLYGHDKPLPQQLAEIAKKENIKILGFEADDLSVTEFAYFKKEVKGVRWKNTAKVIKTLRAIKDEEEIHRLKKAASIADQCLHEVSKTIKIGQTEKETAVSIEMWFRSHGYAPSFSPIVAFDKNAAVPHYDSRIGTGKVQNGSLILVDYGVFYEGYASDTTRILFFGSVSSELKNVYHALLFAQEKTIENIKKFKKVKDLDRFCRREMKKKGINSEYPHVTGHGVGIEVHDNPRIHFLSKESLQTNQVITVEPAIYVSGKYGMRIEDTVLIKENGVELLTKFPKKLQIL